MTTPRELRNWEDAPPEDDMPTTSTEEKAELERQRRLNNPLNIYQVCHLTIDAHGEARLFPIDGFPKLALAQQMVSERALEGKSKGLVILAQAAAVAGRLGE